MYVDGFVIPVPKGRKADYLKVAQMAAPIYREFGALSVVECWGEDVPPGKVTSFPMAVKLKDDETVVFSWIVWPDKATRDEGQKRVMTDPRMQMPPDGMPFDGQRMIFGGFEILLEA
jgi:uncharacterized protein YbaA (DUF1428 family)